MAINYEKHIQIAFNEEGPKIEFRIDPELGHVTPPKGEVLRVDYPSIDEGLRKLDSQSLSQILDVRNHSEYPRGSVGYQHYGECLRELKKSVKGILNERKYSQEMEPRQRSRARLPLEADG